MNDMTDKSELKPCPFEAVDKEYKHELSVAQEDVAHNYFRVCCPCGCRGPVGLDRETAIRDWNTRTLPPEIKAVVEAAKEWVNNPGKFMSDTDSLRVSVKIDDDLYHAVNALPKEDKG